MKQENPANLLIEYSKKLRQSSDKFQPIKAGQAYQSYFFRNSTQQSSVSPCQSSKTKRLERTTSRKNERRTSVYNQFLKNKQPTSNNEIEILRQQNIELKKAIADLKISCFYRIDESKIKTMILDLEQAKNDLKLALQQIQDLRLENDFLSRANTLLRVEVSKLQKNVNGLNSKKELTLADKKLFSAFCQDNVNKDKKVIDNRSPNNRPPSHAQQQNFESQEVLRMKTLKMCVIKNVKNKGAQKWNQMTKIKSQQLLKYDRLNEKYKNPWLKTIIPQE